MKASRGEIESIVFVVECYTTIIPNNFLKALDSDGKNPECFMERIQNVLWYVY